MIRITSKQHNFRRCRVAHPKGTAEYPDDRFTVEQIKILQAEPKLTVEIVSSAAEAPEDGPAVAEAKAGGEKEQADLGEQIEGVEEEQPDLTVREIKERLEEMRVEFPPKAKKEELQKLLAEKMSGQVETE